MPRKIDNKRISFNAAFGISPARLAKELANLPLTARILTIDTVTRPGSYTTHVDITYYTQPPKKEA
mgnify:CR=1 FL=1